MNKLITILTLIAAVVLAVPTYVNAEENACVTIKGGSGFAAKMQIVAGDYSTKWSGTFNVTETHCQSLDQIVPAGAHYKVRIQAVLLGVEVDCTPATKRAEGVGSLLWRASGTSNITCKAPT